MTHYKHDHRSEFNLEGRFLGFAAKDGYKLRYLRLSTANGEQTIKIPKELCLSLYRTLTPGTWVQVSGSEKLNWEKGTVKLKASQITPVSAGAEQSSGTLFSAHSDRTTIQDVDLVEAAAAARHSKATILICQKSDCCKRGGNALVRALQAELGDRGLTDQVTIKPTGCMKRCKMGPNLVMPDKTRYSQIQAKTVPALLEKHFPPAASHS